MIFSEPSEPNMNTTLSASKSSWQLTGTCDAPLYYIDIGSLTDDGDMPSPVLAVTVTDGYGHEARHGLLVLAPASIVFPQLS